MFNNLRKQIKIGNWVEERLDLFIEQLFLAHHDPANRHTAYVSHASLRHSVENYTCVCVCVREGMSERERAVNR